MDERLQAGIAAARAGKTAQAADLLDQMVRDDPDNVLALVWLAAITPDVDEAVRLLERAVTLDPDNARARAGLTWAYRRQAESFLIPTREDTSQQDTAQEWAASPAPTYAAPTIEPQVSVAGSDDGVWTAATEDTEQDEEDYTDFGDAPTPQPIARSRRNTAPTSARGSRRAAFPKGRVAVAWPLGLCALAVGVALLTFVLPTLAAALGGVALLVAVGGVLLLGRVAF